MLLHVDLGIANLLQKQYPVPHGISLMGGDDLQREDEATEACAEDHLDSPPLLACEHVQVASECDTG